VVKGTRQAGRREGGRPSEAGECAHSEPPYIMRHRRWRSVAIGGVLGTNAKASYSKKVGLSAKLRSVLTTNPRRHEAQKVENLSRLWSARNGRHDIMTHKSGRHSEAWGVLGCHQPATAVFEEKVGDPTCDGGP